MGRFTPQDMELASTEIVQQAKRAAEVIKRIRAFVSKKESRQVPVEIEDLITDCSAVYEASAHRAGVQVTVDLAPDLPVISADPIQLQQVGAEPHSECD